jgi:hypothetical protein
MKAVRSMFTNKSSSSSAKEEGGNSGQSDNDNDDYDLDALMQRPEVSEFISSVNASIDDSICRPVLDIITPMSGVGKMISRLSVGNPLAASPSYSKRSLMYSPLRERDHRHRNQPPPHHYHHHHHQSNAAAAAASSMYSPASAFPGVSGAYLHGPGGHDSILAAFPAISNAIANPSSEATFEESEKLIARMIDVRHTNRNDDGVVDNDSDTDSDDDYNSLHIYILLYQSILINQSAIVLTHSTIVPPPSSLSCRWFNKRKSDISQEIEATKTS